MCHITILDRLSGSLSYPLIPRFRPCPLFRNSKDMTNIWIELQEVSTHPFWFFKCSILVLIKQIASKIISDTYLPKIASWSIHRKQTSISCVPHFQTTYRQPVQWLLMWCNKSFIFPQTDYNLGKKLN